MTLEAGRWVTQDVLDRVAGFQDAAAEQGYLVDPCAPAFFVHLHEGVHAQVSVHLLGTVLFGVVDAPICGEERHDGPR